MRLFSKKKVPSPAIVLDQCLEHLLSPHDSPSPFFDSAHEHIFSDWLMAAAFEMGQDLSELVPGGLPDLSEGVEVVDGERRIIQAALRKTRLLKFGKYLAKYLRGKTLIDLGAGDLRLSIAPHFLAQWAMASAYWACDPRYRETQGQDASGFSAHFPLDLRSIPSLRTSPAWPSLQRLPKIFLLSGIELKDPHSASSQALVLEIMQTLAELCQKGDGIILCVSSRDCDVKSPHFSKIYDDAYIEFFLRKN